jgi:hypothetical protein
LISFALRLKPIVLQSLSAKFSRSSYTVSTLDSEGPRDESHSVQKSAVWGNITAHREHIGSLLATTAHREHIGGLLAELVTDTLGAVD